MSRRLIWGIILLVVAVSSGTLVYNTFWKEGQQARETPSVDVGKRDLVKMERYPTPKPAVQVQAATDPPAKPIVDPLPQKVGKQEETAIPVRPVENPVEPAKAGSSAGKSEEAGSVKPFIKAVEGGIAVYNDDPAQGGKLYMKKSIPLDLLSGDDKIKFNRGFQVGTQAEALGILEDLNSMLD